MNDFRMDFADEQAVFLASADAALLANEPWAPVVITRAQIDEELRRLADGPAPANGRRASLIVHPKSQAHAPGLAPGIQVVLSVLKPGERTTPFRHNATEVNFCIRGSGRFHAEGHELPFRIFDVWNTPSYQPYMIVNDGDDLQVRLTYSNASLLRAMQIYVTEEMGQIASDSAAEMEIEADDARRTSPYGTFEIANGALLMPYERLINPPAVASPLLHWPWERVEAELLKLETLGADYMGRRLYLLYNPMTGRTNGTTPSFFATMTIRPADIVDRPHRHTSAAINYYFRGSGRSTVAGRTYEWSAGDLMLSAPGWAVHNHASYGERVYELTVQDQPLNIAMESLLWQENLKAPAALLGSQSGFETNRGAAAVA